MNLSPTTDVPGAFVDTVRDAFAGRAGDRFTLVLSGGPTARTCYERLAEATGIDWPAVDVYVGDERFVPADDADANQRLIREALLDRVGGAGSFTPMPTEPGGPDDCAAAYQEVIAGLLAGPGIDLIHLGLGTDGHTASLFPGSPPDADDDALVRAVYSDERAMWRITITPKVINASRTVAFAVEGVEKAAILEAVLEGPRDPVALPSQIVAPSPGRLLWLADVAAAGTLRTT